MQANAVKNFVPKAAKAIEEGNELAAVSTKYERTATDVHRNFYNEETAAKGASRVEID